MEACARPEQEQSRAGFSSGLLQTNSNPFSNHRNSLIQNPEFVFLFSIDCLAVVGCLSNVMASNSISAKGVDRVLFKPSPYFQVLYCSW